MLDNVGLCPEQQTHMVLHSENFMNSCEDFKYQTMRECLTLGDLKSQGFYCGSWPGSWEDQESVIGIGSSSREWSPAASTCVKRKNKRAQEEEIFKRITVTKNYLSLWQPSLAKMPFFSFLMTYSPCGDPQPLFSSTPLVIKCQ